MFACCILWYPCNSSSCMTPAPSYQHNCTGWMQPWMAVVGLAQLDKCRHEEASTGRTVFFWPSGEPCLLEWGSLSILGRNQEKEEEKKQQQQQQIQQQCVLKCISILVSSHVFGLWPRGWKDWDDAGDKFQPPDTGKLPPDLFHWETSSQECWALTAPGLLAGPGPVN